MQKFKEIHSQHLSGDGSMTEGASDKICVIEPEVNSTTLSDDLKTERRLMKNGN